MRLKIKGTLKDKNALARVYCDYVGAMNDSLFFVNAVASNYLFQYHYVVIGMDAKTNNDDESVIDVCITLTPCDMACYRHIDFKGLFELIEVNNVEELKD